MRNFFKGSNEVPPTPEAVAPSESIAPAEDVVELKKEIDWKDFDEFEKQVAIAESAAIPVLEDYYNKEKIQAARQEEIVSQIVNMVKGNKDLNNRYLENPSLSTAEYEQELTGVNEKINPKLEEIRVEWRKWNALRERLLALSPARDSVELPVPLQLLQEKVAKKLWDLDWEKSQLYNIPSNFKKNITEHTDRQKHIANNPVDFAIKTVRAANPDLVGAGKLFYNEDQLRGFVELELKK